MMAGSRDEYDEDVAPERDDGSADWDPDDRDAPLECDLARGGDEDEAETVPCPHCRREVPDFADRCHHCGEWIVQSAGAHQRNLWYLPVVIIVLAIVAAWAML
jgi:hypothetical protein